MESASTGCRGPPATPSSPQSHPDPDLPQCLLLPFPERLARDPHRRSYNPRKSRRAPGVNSPRPPLVTPVGDTLWFRCLFPRRSARRSSLPLLLSWLKNLLVV